MLSLFKKRKKIGLALAAGGAKGMVYIPFLEALDEEGLAPTIVSGSSVGALIAGLYAAGVSTQSMREILDDLTPHKMRSIFHLHIGRGGLIGADGVRSFLRSILRVTRFEDTRSLRKSWSPIIGGGNKSSLPPGTWLRPSGIVLPCLVFSYRKSWTITY